MTKELSNTGFLGASSPVQSISSSRGLRTLPPHVDRIAMSAAFFTVLYSVLAGPLSRFIIPKQWASFTNQEKTDRKLRVVSLTQSIILGPASLYVLIAQHTLWEPRGLVERVYGYYELETQITNFALGYFLWHFAMMIIHYKKHGIQMVLHSVVGVGRMSGVYVPFTCTLTVWFLVYEVTNIPHNIYRFLARLGRGTSQASVINAFIWIALFFIFRILWGTYATVHYLRDVFSVWNISTTNDELGEKQFVAFKRLENEGLRPQPIGSWTVILCVFCAVVLASLNCVWFYLIVKTTLRKVSEPRGSTKSKP